MKRITILTLLLAAAAAAPTAAAPDRGGRVVHLTATAEVKTWTSPGTVTATDELLAAVRVEGERLTGEQAGVCCAWFYGRGVAVKFATPRHGRGHVHISVVTVGKPVLVTVRYQHD